MIDQITLDAIAGLTHATSDIIHEIALGFATTTHMTRGRVLPLTALERLARMRYLAGDLPLSKLDNGIDKNYDRVLGIDGYGDPDGDGEIFCPDGFYLLKEHNGGKDPRAPDPFDRWRRPGQTFVNRTCDCIGGACWCGGWDRFQAKRFAHIYDGWINTDSMIMDAVGPQKCFVSVEPEPGCYVVCASGTPGHVVGHIGNVLEVPAGKFDRKDVKHWQSVIIVDCASRSPNKANKKSTAKGWYGTGALFIKSIMS